MLHQIYEIDHGRWEEMLPEERVAVREEFLELTSGVVEGESVQLITFSVVGRADWGLLLTAPSLEEVDRFEKAISRLGSGLLVRDYSFLSLTEESEYKTSDEEFAVTLEREERVRPGTAAFEERMKAFQERMAKYRHERIYPKFGGWEAICFYPMAKRRGPEQNWYALPYEERRRLMAGHAKVGRTYAGRVKQLISGATGLSDWEWGVTLFANSIDEFKSIIYEMRFDPVTHTYGEFGPFYIGQILAPEALADRLGW